MRSPKRKNPTKPRIGYVKGRWGRASVEGSGVAFLTIVVAIAAGAGAYLAAHYWRPPSDVIAEREVRRQLDSGCHQNLE